MSLKLTKPKPDDRYARMYFRFVSPSKIEYRTEEEADESCGWIEFWSEDAKACKESLRRIAGRLYVLSERREKRTKDLSDDKALDELNEYNRLLVEGLAHRTKAWALVNSEGEKVEAPFTFENAKAILGDEDHNLREVIQDFLKDRVNFPLRASENS